jgi:hypothetical protein
MGVANSQARIMEKKDGVVEFLGRRPKQRQGLFAIPWSLYQAIRHAKILTVEPVVFLHMFGMYLSLPLFQLESLLLGCIGEHVLPIFQ